MERRRSVRLHPVHGGGGASPGMGKTLLIAEEYHMEIFFSDLKKEAQKRVLELYNVSTPEEANLDVFPLVELVGDYDDEGEDNES